MIFVIRASAVPEMMVTSSASAVMNTAANLILIFILIPTRAACALAARDTKVGGRRRASKTLRGTYSERQDAGRRAGAAGSLSVCRADSAVLAQSVIANPNRAFFMASSLTGNARTRCPACRRPRDRLHHAVLDASRPVTQWRGGAMASWQELVGADPGCSVRAARDRYLADNGFNPSKLDQAAALKPPSAADPSRPERIEQGGPERTRRESGAAPTPLSSCHCPCPSSRWAWRLPTMLLLLLPVPAEARVGLHLDLARLRLGLLGKEDAQHAVAALRRDRSEEHTSE